LRRQGKLEPNKDLDAAFLHLADRVTELREGAASGVVEAPLADLGLDLVEVGDGRAPQAQHPPANQGQEHLGGRRREGREEHRDNRLETCYTDGAHSRPSDGEVSSFSPLHWERLRLYHTSARHQESAKVAKG
jgi:hypothetical protein